MDSDPAFEESDYSGNSEYSDASQRYAEYEGDSVSQTSKRFSRSEGFEASALTESSSGSIWRRKEWRALLYRMSLSMGVAWVLAISGVMFSSFAYLFFYFRLVPGVFQLDVPVYFDYDADGLGTLYHPRLIQSNGIYDESIHKLRDFLYNGHGRGQSSDDSKCGVEDSSELKKISYPIANIELKHAAQQWIPASSLGANSDSVEKLDPRVGEGPTLSTGFTYDIWLELAAPAIDSFMNDHGNFMVTLELLSEKTPVAISRRPVLIRSPPLVKPSFSIFGWFFGSSERPMSPDSYFLKINMFEKYTERHGSVIDSLRVRLSSPYVRLVEAKLKFRCHLSGVLYYMYYYPVTCFSLFMIGSVIVQATLAVAAVGLFGLLSAVVLFSSGRSDDLPEVDMQ